MQTTQMSDQNKPSNQSLTDKIAELEALLARNKSSEEPVPVLEDEADEEFVGDIPILDELVHAEDADELRQHAEQPSATAEQLMDLINNIEHRLTDELETLVKTLKITMKESIIDELKSRLETPVDSQAEVQHRPSANPLRQDHRNT